MKTTCLTASLILLALPLSACKAVQSNHTGSKKIYHKSDPNIHKPAPRVAVSKQHGSRPPTRSHNGETGEISSISIQDLFTLQQQGDVLIIDARHHYFYQMGHIPGAISLHSKNCDQQIQKLETDLKAALNEEKIIAVYCSGFLCKDARIVSRHLASFGYPVHQFYGGWNAWQDAGLPTEK